MGVRAGRRASGSAGDVRHRAHHLLQTSRRTQLGNRLPIRGQMGTNVRWGFHVLDMAAAADRPPGVPCGCETVSDLPALDEADGDIRS